LDILKKSIKSNTKLIIVNVPHNPTGKAIKWILELIRSSLF
jgi:aspartate/methionine/tyrosine aminotransferase